MNKPIVVGMGEALWDVLPDGKKIGGAPANFAFHAGQAGMDSRVVSAVGNDALGEEALATLEGKGLNIEAVARVDFPTGVVNVSLGEQGIPQYDICEGVAWDNIPFTPALANLARQAQTVCWGSLAQRNEVSRNTIYQFLDSTPDDCLKIFDINLRQNFYTKEIICESLKRCNILKINDEELITLGRLFGYPGLDIENKCWLILGKYNLDMLVLTCGVNGSYVFAPGCKSFHETPHVEVADTVGAGDSFTGTFCACILKGMTIAQAHKHAVEVSDYVCTQHGAMPALPESLKR